MGNYESLRELQQKAARKPLLEQKLDELYRQRRTYEREIISLRASHQEEAADVEKLEGRSLARYFYSVIGSLDEKLDQERQEVYAARVKLDAAEREMEEISRDIASMKEELSDAKQAQLLLADALLQKREQLKTSGSIAGEQILFLEQEIATLQARKQEIREAIWAGNDAKSTSDRILSKLDSAEDWNNWDMFGGGIITHIAKHNNLDDAQNLVEELQGRLRKFKTELADVQITTDLQVSIDGFLRFADYFFDGLFADWAVGEKIRESISAVQGTKSQIVHTIDNLRAMEAIVDQQIAKLQETLDELTVAG